MQLELHCPQGGGLSPTLWSAVADSLLKWSSKQGDVYAQRYADDGVVLIIGKIIGTLCDIAQRILKGIEVWCQKKKPVSKSHQIRNGAIY